MTPSELMADLPAAPGHEREARLHARLLLRYVASHVYSAELNSGAGLRDAGDFMAWLDELAEAIPSGRDQLGQRMISDPEPCPRCGHVHEGDRECGFEYSMGRICRCEMEVPA